MQRKYDHSQKDLLRSMGYLSLNELWSDLQASNAHAIASAIVVLATNVSEAVKAMLLLAGAVDTIDDTMSVIAERLEHKIEQLDDTTRLLVTVLVAADFKSYIEALNRAEAQAYDDIQPINTIPV